jgi:hypothetical protein
LTSLLAAVVLLAACDLSVPQTQAPAGSSPTPRSSPSGSARPSSTTAVPTPTRPPGTTPTAETSPRPSVTTTAGASALPTSGASASPGASPLGSPGDLASCSGSDDNRAFFNNAAAAFAWDVYCAVLPKGWYVESGNYQGASGGQLTIAYRTTAGLRFELKQGNYCTGAACGPMDSTLGAAMLGDREGQLGMLGSNLVLYVDPGSSPGWQAVGIGLNEATFRAYSAALVKVPG